MGNDKKTKNGSWVPFWLQECLHFTWEEKGILISIIGTYRMKEFTYSSFGLARRLKIPERVVRRFIRKKLIPLSLFVKCGELPSGVRKYPIYQFVSRKLTENQINKFFADTDKKSVSNDANADKKSVSKGKNIGENDKIELLSIANADKKSVSNDADTDSDADKKSEYNKVHKSNLNKDLKENKERTGTENLEPSSKDVVNQLAEVITENALADNTISVSAQKAIKNETMKPKKIKLEEEFESIFGKI